MLKKVLLAVVALVVVLVAVVATRPSEWKVERSTSIQAPAEVVYARVADLQQFDTWSPWGKIDPAMKKSFTGTPSQLGQVYAWEGNDDVGSGSMTMAKLAPNDHAVYDIHFLKPFESKALATMTVGAEGTGTKATWAFTGQNNFAAKAFSMMMDMDKMLGADFEKGLAQLKALSEQDAVQRVEDAKKAAEMAAAAVTPPVDAAVAPSAAP